MGTPDGVLAGEELDFARRLKAADKWPPQVSIEQFRSDEIPPATPFLFIPDGPFDLGRRPNPDPGSVAWVTSPSIFLLNESGRFQFGARLDTIHRVLAIVGNAGDAPVVSGIAEFSLDYPPITPMDPESPRYERVPRIQRELVGAGRSSFSVGSRDWGWALSPPWVPEDGDWDLGACLAVQVYDPIHDGPPAALASWDQRKVGLRALELDLGGTWTGEEMSEQGELLGTVTVTLSPDWTISQIPRGLSIPTCEVIPVEFPVIPGRPLALGVGKRTWMEGGVSVVMVNAPRWQDVWVMYFGELRKGNTLRMRTQKGIEQFSHAVLTRKAAGPLPPSPDRSLLSRIPRVMSPSWSPQRKKEAEFVFDAIASLGP